MTQIARKTSLGIALLASAALTPICPYAAITGFAAVVIWRKGIQDKGEALLTRRTAALSVA